MEQKLRLLIYIIEDEIFYIESNYTEKTDKKCNV